VLDILNRLLKLFKLVEKVEAKLLTRELLEDAVLLLICVNVSLNFSAAPGLSSMKSS
jgi:hypothetical protein